LGSDSALVINDNGAALQTFSGGGADNGLGALTVPVTFTASGGAATNGISYTEGTGANLGATDLSNSTDAQAALTAVNSAITDVAAQRGYLGAQINTLNAVASVESTEQTNVVSAQNNILATDYGQATTQLSSEQILSQTGISALAQANTVQQEVLKLLQ
jgi:flagellin